MEQTHVFVRIWKLIWIDNAAQEMLIYYGVPYIYCMQGLAATSTRSDKQIKSGHFIKSIQNTNFAVTLFFQLSGKIPIDLSFGATKNLSIRITARV